MRLVIGTRPEAIKLAPVARALAAANISFGLILTGQHPTLDLADHGLAGFTTAHLRCRGQPDPRAHALAVATRLADILAPAPRLVVVQGDTSSALGGAIAATALGIPLAHVEAGLRTHDLALPWPEEEFRVAIDRRADLLFAPTELSAANLRAEKVPGEILVTGNTGIDAIVGELATLPEPIAREQPTLLVTCHRRESWGAGLEAIARALLALAGAGVAIEFVLHPNPAVAETMRNLLGEKGGIALIQPLAYRAMLAAMRAATIILSDSGGIQEEAAAMGAPLLVLREKTERPEAIDTGNMILVGTDSDRIVSEVRRLLADRRALQAMAQPALPYGDGHAAPRIAAAIAEWFAARPQKENGAPRGTPFPFANSNRD